MFDQLTVIIVVCLYIGILFSIALWVERQASAGRSIGNNPFIYSLSLAVYCTTWTYYGSVGKAATSGMLFLAIYLGPTIAIALWWTVLRKMVRIKNTYRITSIADFISVRYNKSRSLAALVTIAAVTGLIPYIALQLKAVIATFDIITIHSHFTGHSPSGIDVSLLVAVLMIFFTIIFGARRLDPTERHQGMVVALAVECVVKLIAFLAAGIFVTYILFDGFGDIFQQLPDTLLKNLSTSNETDGPFFLTWTTYLVLAMSSILFLPRQFHISVIENFDENHIRTAMWLFPLYMFLINLFVFPIAMAGLLKGFPVQGADTFVIDLPLHAGEKWLSLFVFIGGFSAAAGMIMISSMTMATMITNHLMLPVISWFKRLAFMKRYLLQCRWMAVAAYILIGYLFERNVGESFMLVNMGMISFAAALQFAPPIIGGLFWKEGNKVGAISGLVAGFPLWFYTLMIPAFVMSGRLPEALLQDGPWGIALLRPEHLFGLNGFDPLSHAVFWTMFFNIGFYLFGSLYAERSAEEQHLSEEFITVLKSEEISAPITRREAFIDFSVKRQEMTNLLCQYFTDEKAKVIIGQCLQTLHIDTKRNISIDELIEFHAEVEKTLAGSIGASAAYHAIHRGIIYAPEEERELSNVYAEILANLKLTPSELKKKADYFQEREKLLKSQSEELEEKIKERDREIVERTQAEKALADSEEKYRTLIENLNIGVYRNTGGPYGRFIQANPAMLKIFGYENLGDFMEIYVSDLYQNPEERRIFIEEVFKKGSVKDREVPMRKKDGTPIWASVTANVQYDETGTIKWLDGVLEDISERKHLEDQLRHAQKMEAVGTLAGGIAHDFNNILTAIIGYGCLLKDEIKKDEHQKQYIDYILTSADRAAILVRSLLAFGRKQILSIAPVRVNHIVLHLKALLLRIIGEDIALETVLTSEDLVVMADAGQLEQVLMNLVTNAKDAMTGGGTITLRTESTELNDEFIKTYGFGKSGRYARLSIEDTGTGMDDMTKERIFEPFFTTKEVGKGTGLGLAMVYGIIKQHDGYITVHSKSGNGTLFHIYLPLISKEVRESAFPIFTSPPKRGTETVLLAEDDKAVRKITKDILEGSGYAVIEAEDGEDAMKKFEAHKDEVELLIFDVIMPKKSGTEAYEEIRKQRPAIRILFTSGYTADIIHRKGIVEEDQHFISKPVPPDTFLRKIREVLDK